MMTTADPVFRPGTPGLIPDAWIVGAGSAEPPVVVVHGIQRQAAKMARLLVRRARETGRTVILPEFCVEHWKRYQVAACASRSDLGLLSLLGALRDENRIAPGRVDMAGFSGGAQFSHRFAWLYPDRVGRLCVTAPGWWTFPDDHAPWPYGMGVSTRRRGIEAVWLRANLRRFLDREIVVTVGTDDTRRDANLRSGPEIDAQQGRNRVERARNWVQAMRGAAHDASLVPNIRFGMLEGCGHSFSDCVARAELDRLFVVPWRPCAGCRKSGACPKLATMTLIERSAA